MKLNNNKVSGYVAVFNSPSKPLQRSDGQQFIETIARGAFSKTLADGHNIFALSSHNREDVLGSTAAGTLTLKEDDNGLLAELSLPDTSVGRDIGALLARGEPYGGSFTANVDDWAWGSGADGVMTCELRGLELTEVTLTAFPAYPETSVVLRSTRYPAIPTPKKEEPAPIPEEKTEIPIDTKPNIEPYHLRARIAAL